MKQRPSDTSKRIPRIFQAIICIALIKVGLLGYYGVSGYFVPETASLPGIQVAQAAQAEEKKATPPAAAAQKKVTKPVVAAPEQGADALAKEWANIREKQQDLSRRESELRALEKNIDAKLAEEKKIQAGIRQMIEDAQVLKDKKIKHLIEVYSNMKAKQAALVLESLDESIAVKILAGMRGRTAGEILSYVKPKTAALLSEKLTDLRIPFQNEE